MEQLVSAGILAGGKSSRMGENKARLVLGDLTFLERAVSACRCFPSLRISVDDVSRYQDLSWPMVEDELKEFGPVEGIYQLLKMSETPYVLVIAADMPFLKEDFLLGLADYVTGKEDCVVLTLNGKVQPLCSIYGKSILPVLEEMRKNQEHKVRLLYTRTKVRYVDAAMLGDGEKMLKNINTRDEYDETVKEFL
ncbi:MAG: molybdenum cofactor guanylyltransferase [Ruminococcus sp.]|jgi:molybdopterin-guanine dinucleotide biosynthesis protein A